MLRTDFLQDSCSATVLKRYPDPEPNMSNVDDVINNLNIKDINLNNIRGCVAFENQNKRTRYITLLFKFKRLFAFFSINIPWLLYLVVKYEVWPP
jgi:hypothetical protein